MTVPTTTALGTVSSAGGQPPQPSRRRRQQEGQSQFSPVSILLRYAPPPSTPTWLHLIGAYIWAVEGLSRSVAKELPEGMAICCS
ncbi:hypothetical protein NC651_012030 [Populus alba x Populus x berolinensis]|nr:hypothetical protein NC651_012030 [Populus alba x Populus x berolinensis]